MKISVVIPVYNVERYICRCIDSVLSQTYQNFEVIIVDDHSPDNSIQLAKSYESEKIKIVSHSRNKGLPASRNTGVAHCAGDYLIFLDSDDFLLPHALEKSISTAQSYDSDIVSFNSHRVNESGYTWPITWHEKFNSADVCNISIMEYPQLVWDAAAWNKLINLSFYRENNFMFDEDQKWFEDHLFSLQLFLNTEKVSIIHDVLHHYSARNDELNPSITQSKCFGAVLYRLNMMESVISHLQKTGNSWLTPHFFKLVMSFYRSVLKHAYEAADSKESLIDVLTRFKKIFNQECPSIFHGHHFETVDLALCLKYQDHHDIDQYFDSTLGRIKTTENLLAMEFPEKKHFDIDFQAYRDHHSYLPGSNSRWYSLLIFALTQPFYLMRQLPIKRQNLNILISKNLGAYHIYKSGLFNKVFYTAQSRRHFKSIRAAITDYVFVGEDAGYNPNSFFTADSYLNVNPDLRHWKGNLFGHFLMHGISKGRSIR